MTYQYGSPPPDDGPAAGGYGQPADGHDQPGPGYGAPGPGGYGQRRPGYGQGPGGRGAPPPGYGPQEPGYGPQEPGYGPQEPGYRQDPRGRGAPQPGYGPPQPGYGPPPPGYGAQGPGYGPDAGYGPQAPPAYANWLQRVGAFLIDAVGPWVLAFIGRVSGISALYVLLSIVAVALWGYNRWWVAGPTGQSWGKKALNIRLIRETGEAPGAALAFGRDIAHFVDGILCGIGYLFPLWDAKSQTLADKIVSTVVVPA